MNLPAARLIVWISCHQISFAALKAGAPAVF